MLFDVKIYGLKRLDIKNVVGDTPCMDETSGVCARTTPGEGDRIDEMLEVWTREIPDLDPLTEGIAERIQVLAKSFDRSMDETLAQFGVDRRTVHLLARLRAAGAPYRRSPGQLAAEMRLSSGTMTNRLDRLETSGLIRRLPDPDDRRGTLIEPTEAGHAAWDRTLGTQARREAMFGSVLSEPEREELHRLLRSLMRAFPEKGQPLAEVDLERAGETGAIPPQPAPAS
jgi:DNA-binding MarR family transcriptional regulator